MRSKYLMRPDGFPMRHEDIYRALGVQGRYLPDEGVPPTMVQGVLIQAVAKIPGKAQDGNRTLARCPTCHRWVGFARLRQHTRACES